MAKYGFGVQNRRVDPEAKNGPSKKKRGSNFLAQVLISKIIFSGLLIRLTQIFSNFELLTVSEENILKDV